MNNAEISQMNCRGSMWRGFAERIEKMDKPKLDDCEIALLPVAYVGGHHVVVCNGEHHWCIPEDQGIWYQGKCWHTETNPYQAKAAIAAAGEGTMREYRGKRKDNGEWVYGWYCKVGRWHLIIRDKADIVNPCGGLVIDPYPNYYIRGWVEVIPETVGQQTGLKDKDFWQDDVLESADKLRKYVIKWNDKKGQWYLHGIGKAWCVNGDEINWDEYTKIGDIHSNPELLK